MLELGPEGPPRTARYLRSLPLEQRLRLHIPKEYRGSTLPEDGPVRRYAKRWGTDTVPEGMGLRLVGPSGTGKSEMAAALLHWLVSHKEISGAWVSTRTYLDMVHADYQPGGLIASGYNEQYALLYIRRRYDVLVLDGLGQERRTGQSDSIIHELLRDRGDELLTTIITTSMTMLQIAERYGESCADYIKRKTLEVPT